jgi:hypothetical protein
MWGAYHIWSPSTALPDDYGNLKYDKVRMRLDSSASRFMRV